MRSAGDSVLNDAQALRLVENGGRRAEQLLQTIGGFAYCAGLPAANGMAERLAVLVMRPSAWATPGEREVLFDGLARISQFIGRLRPGSLIDIQPDEAISLSFSAKIPGPQLYLGTVDMRFAYKDYFGERPSTGYERLLYDCMTGDATLFQRSDMVEAGWSVVAPILDVWKALPPRDFPNYEAGSWGPKEADDLMARNGRAWYHTPDRK